MPYQTFTRSSPCGAWARFVLVDVQDGSGGLQEVEYIASEVPAEVHPVTALRCFALESTDHRTHREQDSMIRRCIAWRNRNTENREPRRIVSRANVA